MSIEVMRYVWKHSKSKANARLMLLAIADIANDNGDAYPGVDKLGTKCNISHRCAQEVIQDLERLGELLVFENVGTKTISGWTNLYRVVLEGVNQGVIRNPKGEIATARRPTPKKTKAFPKGMQTDAPLEDVQTDAPDGMQIVAPDGMQIDAPKSSEYSSDDPKEGATTSLSSKKTVKPTESIAETIPPNPLVSPLPLSPTDAYIWVWAVISRYVRLEVPAPYKAQFKNYTTAANRKKAKQLVNSIIPITLETFANYVNGRTQNGAKEIKFAYLVDDCITFVMRNYQPPQLVEAASPTEPAPTLTPEQAEQRVMEYNRIMAELNETLVEKVVA